MHFLRRLLADIGKDVRRQASVVRVPEPAGRDREREAYLCACAIVKDEGPYIGEWLALLAAIGVDHVLLYDNDSAAGEMVPVEPWVERGFVTVVPWPTFVGGGNPQYLAYAHAVQLMRGRCRWLAVLDVDEFLFSPGGGSVAEILRRYEDCAALAVYRRDFGTSGHREAPPGLVMENYTRRPPSPRRTRNKVKSIVDPEAVQRIGSAHRFGLRAGLVLRDESRAVVRESKDADGRREERCEILRMNHYITKSREEHERKLERGRMTRRDDWPEKAMKYLEKLDSSATVEDREILAYLPRVRALLTEVYGEADAADAASRP